MSLAWRPPKPPKVTHKCANWETWLTLYEETLLTHFPTSKWAVVVRHMMTLTQNPGLLPKLIKRELTLVSRWNLENANSLFADLRPRLWNANRLEIERSWGPIQLVRLLADLKDGTWIDYQVMNARIKRLASEGGSGLFRTSSASLPKKVWKVFSLLRANLLQPGKFFTLWSLIAVPLRIFISGFKSSQTELFWNQNSNNFQIFANFVRNVMYDSITNS